jgi:uncharacterized protein YhaN
MSTDPTDDLADSSASNENAVSSRDDASISAPSLTFSSLRVRRLYGLEHDLRVDDLCNGVNVIYGSNASGKTTLARALRLLLWPGEAGSERPILSGHFSLGGDAWSVDLEGSTCTYQRERRQASRPTLPPSNQNHRYHLYLPDLLAATDGDESFARQILQEAQGGVDVAGAAENLDWEIPNRRKGATAREMETRRKAVREAETAQRELREQEASLDRLREQLEAAREAAVRVDALRQALDVVEAQTNLEEAQARLDAFPSVMESVRGDEAETLDALQKRLQDAEEEIDERTAARAEAEDVMTDSILPEEGLPEGRFERIRTLVQDLREEERTVRDTETALEGATAEETSAWDRLGTGIDREQAAQIDLPAVERVESHVQKVEEVQGQRSAYQTVHRLLHGKEGEETPDHAALERGLRILHRWLQFPEDRKADELGSASVGLIAAGLAVAVLGAVLWIAESGAPAGFAPALSGLGAIIVTLEVWRRTRSGGAAETDARDAFEDEFRRTGLKPPRWTRESVEEAADTLLDRLQTVRLENLKQSEWERLKPGLRETRETARTLEEERRRIADEIGLDPDLSSRSLPWLVDRISQWQSAYDDTKRLQAKLQAAQETVREQRERLAELVGPYGFEEVTSGAQAEEIATRLETARTELREARDARSRAEDELQRAKQTRKTVKEDIEALYNRLDLEVGEEERLRNRAEMHGEYEEAVAAEREARAVRDQQLRQLRDRDGYREGMEEADPEQLHRRVRQAEDRADRAEDLVRQINEIERDIEDAREGGTLEERRAAYRQARHALVQEREEDYARAAGRVLADYVQEKTRHQGMPPVFERARRLFAEITRHRYELDLDPKTVSFRAIDRVEDRGFDLDALSSGTKVQLLLAVRVAFVESQEQTCRVPLVLDETLANSDEEKATAIIEAIRTISASGRQVFYLTAQRDEVQKWQAGLDGGDVSCSIVSLSDADDLAPAGDGATVPAARPIPDLPDADTRSHADLGAALEVSRWSPREPLGRIPLWYLVEDPGRLLDLVREGIRTWGQLEFQYRRAGLAATGLEEGAFRRIDARADAVASWQEAWHVGRGRPVDRTVLEASGAVSEKFIDGVSELAEEHDGDAAAVLHELRERTDERTKGFYSSKADELEDYLRDHDYLDPRDPKSPEEMWQYVQADLAEERRNGIIDRSDLERLFERLREGPPRAATDE